MSDEAFARRFYSDRAELLSLGVPLQSQRDEFTGEELYTLRSERYFLPPLAAHGRRAGGAADVPLPARGPVRVCGALPPRAPEPDARPPGLPRGADRDRRARRGARSRLLARARGPAEQARDGDLEAADGQVRVLVDRPRRPARAHVDPYALLPHEGSWYVVGRDHESDAIRTFKVLRIRRDIKFATRRERDFRLPKDFDAAKHRPPPPWQMGETVGEARIELSGDTAWWVERTYRPPYGRMEDGRLRHALRRPLAPRRLDPAPRRPRGAARAGRAAPRGRRRPAPRRSDPHLARPRAGQAAPGRGRGAAGAAHRSRQPGALRGAPGAARLPPRRLRRGVERRHPHPRPRRALPADPRGGGRGAPRPAQPRQFRRRLLRRLRGAARRRDPRRQGALRRHVPLAAATDAPRGTRDPARARVRRADDRRRGAPAARPRAQEARGDVRRVRPPADGADEAGQGRGAR